MPEDALQPCAYHVVRYQPNLIRDEWVNIGVLLLDPSSGRVRQRWLEEPADFARLRRLHPAADEDLLLRIPAEFDRQFAGREMDAAAILEKFDETFSNALQLSPRKGLLARDPDAELERVFREQVEPLREPRRGAAEIRTRSDLRAQAADYFRSEKILRLMDRGVRVAEFTYPGDPMRILSSWARTRHRFARSDWRARSGSHPGCTLRAPRKTCVPGTARPMLLRWPAFTTRFRMRRSRRWPAGCL